MKQIIIATRKSRLALIQAGLAKEQLVNHGVNVTFLETSTKGDRDTQSPLREIGGSGLFVREIEKKLLDGKADIAVHSAKDLPYKTADGLVIGAVLKSASSADCLITQKGKELFDGCVIATGSARRVCEGQRLFPYARFCDIRGNVDTRLEKLRRGEVDALILAKAGLDRLSADMSELTVTVLDASSFIPAPCQGIIALECRKDDIQTLSLLKKINDEKTKLRFDAERYMLSLLEADCSVAVGAHAEITGSHLTVHAMLSGRKASASGKYENYRELCARIRKEINE